MIGNHGRGVAGQEYDRGCHFVGFHEAAEGGRGDDGAPHGLATERHGALSAAGVFSPEPESLPGGPKSPLPRYWPAEPETQ